MPTLGRREEGTRRRGGAITLSPDRNQFAFVRYDLTRGESALVIAHAETRSERALARVSVTLTSRYILFE